MKRFLLLALLALPTLAFAQKRRNDYSYTARYYEQNLSSFSVGTGLGVSVYNGDLAGALAFQRQNFYLNPHMSLSLSYRLTHWVSFRAEYARYTLFAEPSGDNWSGQGFRSWNDEFTLALVHDVLPKWRMEDRFERWNGYFFLGAGLTTFEPKDPGSGEPLKGQRVNTLDDYAQTAPVFPMGVAVTYYLKEDYLSLSFEAGYRYTLTDYLDHAPSGANDTYFIYGLKLSFQPLVTRKKDFFSIGRYKGRKGQD